MVKSKIIAIVSFIILVAEMPPKFFSQKLNIELTRSYSLDSLDYELQDQPFQLFSNTIYYSEQLGPILKIYKKDSISESCVYKMDKGLENYFLSFVIDSSQTNIFLLFQNSLVTFPINQIKPTLENYTMSQAKSSISLNDSYDNIYFSNEKIVLTRCYNYATAENDTLYSQYLICNASDLSLVIKNID